MASTSVGAIRIIDASGDPCDNDNGELKVVLSASDDINIGNVVLQSDSGTDIYSVNALTDAVPDLDGQLLLGTHALLSARSAADTTCGITCENSTHNALHVSISDGGAIAHVNTANELDVSTNQAMGTSGITGPAKAISIGGTQSGGQLKELLSDSAGHLQVDVLSSSIDDAIYVDDADWEVDTSKHMLVGGVYVSSGMTITDGDVSPLVVNSIGSLIVDVVEGGVLESAVDGLELGLSNINTVIAQGNISLATLDNAISGNEMQVDVVSGSVGHDITGLASDDNDTVGTSAEKISGADGDVACKRVDIMAHPNNTGYIWIGDNAVTTNGANGGIRLAPGDFYSMDIDNTGDVYAIATVDGENVCFNYFT